uniref:Uncharacterized protein n=1 Tax=Panagrellus redivivus TaxID=6233 RepID=A0A7E4UTW9_PANRE
MHWLDGMDLVIVTDRSSATGNGSEICPEMIPRQLSITIFVIFMVKLASTADSCQKLAVCALDNCLPPATNFPPEADIIPLLLKKANFACVLGPTCYEHCKDCETCQYAQEQMKRLILHDPLSNICPKLEACAQSCLDDHVRDPFSCVFRERCVQYCLDNQDCPACYDIVKRVFTGYCYRAGFIEHYGKKCKVFFDELAADFVYGITV